MAPAAADTLVRYLGETGTKPNHYNAIYTGDLGKHGSELFRELMKREGFAIDNHLDCGVEIFDQEKQNVECGGSGCGCSASMLGIKILPELLDSREDGKVLFMATGALLSAVSVGQTDTIPGIAHLIEITAS